MVLDAGLSSIPLLMSMAEGVHPFQGFPNFGAQPTGKHHGDADFLALQASSPIKGLSGAAVYPF
jgi:hypothetical protein